MIYHLTEQSAWEAALASGVYEPRTLKTDGFIQLSTYGQILFVANLWYKKSDAPILLAVDNSKVLDLKWEGAGEQNFPHLYRPLKIDEVTEVIPLTKDNNGNYMGAPALERAAVALKTPRLLLREFQLTDAENVHAYGSDADLVKYMPWGPNSKNETNAFLSKAFKWQSEVPRKNFEFAIVESASGKLIGGSGIFVKNSDCGFIGYILQKSAHGKGFATELSQALIKFGFNELNLHRIEATCDAENLASLKVLLKSGMKHEGIMRENLLAKGRRRSSMICAVLKTDPVL